MHLELGLEVSSHKKVAPLPSLVRSFVTLRGSTLYVTEFHAIIWSLKHWSHYLVANEFIFHSDHEALKYIQGQHKLNTRHAKWVEYLQTFHFTIKHKLGKLNKAVGALSRRYLLLSQLGVRVLGFE